MIPIKTASAWRGTSDCRNCGIRDMVLFADLSEQDFSLIHAPIDDLEFKPGETLYEEGTQALGIFTVRSGMVKLVRVANDGRRRIVRVLRQGDVAGLEALATGRYDCVAIALAPVSVCRVPLDVIRSMGGNSQRLHANLMHKWQRALKDADDWIADLNFGSASQRVANLLIKMRDPINPNLSTLFSREDMGAMLDLKFETVSREISKLLKEEVIVPIDKLGRLYQINNPELLIKR
jgi:CRP-like cAMP-binding protein